MKKPKIVFCLLLIGCILLNSTAVLAAGSHTFVGSDTVEIHKVLNSKDEVLEKKFQNAKEWLKGTAPSFKQFFLNKQFLFEQISKFRIEMNRVYQEILIRINKLQEKHTTRL